MNYIEYLYKTDYNTLKSILLSKPVTELQAILKDKKIKEKIINSPTRHDFIWFAQTNNDYIFPLLLDDIGIDILNNTTDLIDKMNGILTSGNNYINKLFDNKNFLTLIIDNIHELRSYLYSINANSAKKLLEHTDDTDIQFNILRSLRTETKKLVEIYQINNEILLKSLIALPNEAVNHLIKNDLRITSLNKLKYYDLLSLFNKQITFPSQLLEEKDLVNNISTIHDPKNFRFLIEALKNNNNVEYIETKRKQYYEFEIKSYNKEYNMLTKYYNIYSEINTLINNQELDYNKINTIINKYINPFGNDQEKHILIDKIFKYKNNPEKLKTFFQEESNYLLTNMIIDYHFEDIYYNFLLDLKQLYNFQNTKGKTLSNEDIEMYKTLLDLDNISYEEKLNIFESLKNKNILEKYYDDFRTAKNKSYSMMKEQMLNFDNIKKYQDKELSRKIGVNVYILDGSPFLAFIKSLNKSKNTPLTNIKNSYVDGSSYSLDGSEKLNTFRNPKEYYNIIYGDFNIDQIVHTSPVDSFSKYDRKNNTSGTNRVNELYTPTELVNKSFHYNEIIYSQKNDHKTDELNSKLDKPKELGIYCYDEITENDIESAKQLGLDIILIKTEKYHINKSNEKLNMFDTMTLSFNHQTNGINYIEYPSQDAMISRRK